MSNFLWRKQYPESVPHEINPDEYPSLIHFLGDCVGKYHDLVAFENMGQTITYGELDELSTALANFLVHQTDLQKGDRIALQMPNVLQYPVALFGVLKAGMVVVNTNPQYKPTEMKHQFKDSGARAIIILNTFAYKLEEVLSETNIDHIIIAEIGDLMSSVKGAIVDFMVKKVKKMVPEYDLQNAISFQTAIKKGRKYDYERPDLEPQDVAILQYTGGTTGVAKGACLTHRNLIANIEQTAAWMKPRLVPKEEITICALPLYHVFALMVNCFGMMKIGARNILITDPRNMRDFIKTLRQYPFSVITGVNTLFNGLVNREEFRQVDFSALKIAVAGGMALQDAVANKWKEITHNQIVEGYGLSETSPLLCCNPIDGNDRLGTIGLPVPSTEIRVVDDNGRDCLPTEPGEIWARGPQVMNGYWNKPDETKEVLENNWFKTGDIALFTSEGFLKIVDRKKEMILVGGMNVYPTEVENVIVQLDGVLEAGVVGIPDQKSGELVMAFVVRSDESVTENDILKHCRDHLTAYKMPRSVLFRQELPKTSVGKILRRSLKEELLEIEAN